MFKSSQVSGYGQNVVIFNHACGIETYELPEGTDIYVSFGWGDPDEYDPTITILERVPPEKESQTPEQMVCIFHSLTSFPKLGANDLGEHFSRDPLLKL